jgi:hypothetical protein
LKKIHLGLAIHNHQPLGNFHWVFEQAYKQAYLPMIEALERHPHVRISLHYSGCLIDWIEQNHPEFLNLLAVLVERNQVEIMSGGYYEPILPAIPDADKLGQIAKMSDFVKQRFGTRPEGLWLAERVWEPYLAKILAEAGVKWTLIDDNAFKSLGIEDKDLFGCYITEEQGFTVKLFPISKQLRYSIPWHDVEQVIAYLDSAATDESDRIAVLGDDGEKFGIWPGTYEHCWEKGWIDDLFTALKDNNSWLDVVPVGEYARRFPPLSRIYLPCASYDEMMEWSLPANKSWEYTNLKHRLLAEGRQDIIQFMYSGLWRNFLVKYPEINRMHKKMLRVHGKVYEVLAEDKEAPGLDELWQGQCNCPYWHGVFGGIYLADIRAINYSRLIQAENKADGILRQKRLKSKKSVSSGRSETEWQKLDFDDDGREELLVDGHQFSIYVSLDEGGSIFEWDLRNHSFNVLATIARRPEAYHKVLAESSVGKQEGNGGEVTSIHDLVRIKNKDALRYLIYDSYPRSCLIDHFFSVGTGFEKFASGSYIELGDFVDQPYDFSVQNKDKELKILLKRSGVLRLESDKSPFEVKKEISLLDGEERINIIYRLKNTSDAHIQAVFGSEWNINLLGGGHNEMAYYEVPGVTLEDSHLDSRGELKEVEEIILGNRNLGFEMQLTIEPRIGLWRFPVESVSNSEGGVELIYQESCLVFLLPLDLPPGGKTELGLVWRIRKTPAPEFLNTKS